jgi:hypothetical protein
MAFDIVFARPLIVAADAPGAALSVGDEGAARRW